jgi:hypothetical protein
MHKPAKLSSIYPAATTRFEDFAVIHQAFTPQVHFTPLFLPWHRYFMYVTLDSFVMFKADDHQTRIRESHSLRMLLDWRTTVGPISEVLPEVQPSG